MAAFSIVEGHLALHHPGPKCSQERDRGATFCGIRRDKETGTPDPGAASSDGRVMLDAARTLNPAPGPLNPREPIPGP